MKNEETDGKKGPSDWALTAVLPSKPPQAVKACACCIHHRPYQQFDCARWTETDLISGEEKVTARCYYERSRTEPEAGKTSIDPCGPMGKHWQAKPPVEKVVKPGWWARFQSWVDRNLIGGAS